jgi:hypothetical protein
MDDNRNSPNEKSRDPPLALPWGHDRLESGHMQAPVSCGRQDPSPTDRSPVVLVP